MYRFSTDNGTVFRAKMHRCPSDSERWQYFWDSCGSVAFYKDFRDGCRTVPGSLRAVTERAITALTNEGHEALDKVAKRHADGPGAHFFVVHLDRSLDLYVLSYHEDNTAYRDSIEACWHGDVWAIETEMLDAATHTWEQGHGDYDVIYGEAEAERVLHEEFPLDEFPAELTVGA